MEVGARSKRICAPATAAAVTVPSPCQRREGMTGSSGRGVTFLADASRKLRCRRRQGLRGKRKSHTSFASSFPEDQVVGPCRRCLSLSPCARVSSGHEHWGRAGTFTATGSIGRWCVQTRGSSSRGGKVASGRQSDFEAGRDLSKKKRNISFPPPQLLPLKISGLWPCFYFN